MTSKIKLILFFLVFLSLRLNAAEPLWDQAIESLKSDRFEEASTKFSEWIQLKEAEGISSPEAHYNLFLAQMGLEATDRAVLELLKSIQLEANPFKAMDSIHSLCEIQNSLGIKDGFCQSKGFILSLLVGKNSLLLTAVLAFWFCLAGIILFIRRQKDLGRILVGTGCFFIAITTIFYFCYRLKANLAVLSSADKTIPVYKNYNFKEDEKIVELAAGTLIDLTRHAKENAQEISQPVLGWVLQENILTLK